MINQPLKALFRFILFILSSISLIVIVFVHPITTDALVKGWTPVEEEFLSSEANGDNPLKIVIVPSKNNETIESEEIGNADQSIAEIGSNNSADIIEDLIFPFSP